MFFLKKKKNKQKTVCSLKSCSGQRPIEQKELLTESVVNYKYIKHFQEPFNAEF